MNAGKTGRSKQLGKTALGLTGLQGDAVKQKLVVRNAKNETSVRVLRQSLLQLAPSRLELSFGTLVVGSVKARVLNKNVKAVEERPRGRAAACIDLRDVGDSFLPYG